MRVCQRPDGPSISCCEFAQRGLVTFGILTQRKQDENGFAIRQKAILLLRDVM